MDIEIVEARTHTLQGVSCRVPHYALTVVTGVSGSGKSSLAFDTLFAEGQRRYLETLSTYTRQFLAQMPRPPVRAVRNVPPSLALRQGVSAGSPRSTVASLTELGDHLRYVFAGLGVTHCVGCGAEVERFSPAKVVSRLERDALGKRVVVIGVVRVSDGDVAGVLRALAADGYRRVLHEGRTVELDSVDILALLQGSVVLRVVIDRMTVDAGSSRLLESVEAAMHLGDCVAEIVFPDEAHRAVTFFEQFVCGACGQANAAPIPQLFDARGRMGMCSACAGVGHAAQLDELLAVPDDRKSIRGGALLPLDEVGATFRAARVAAIEARGIDVDVPWSTLSVADREVVLFGDGQAASASLGAVLSAVSRRVHTVVERFYSAHGPCRRCRGTGLSDAARAVRVRGTTMAEVLNASIHDALICARGWRDGSPAALAMDTMLAELETRLHFLDRAGVGYLALSRGARTLSGGEIHRVLLAASVGRSLTDTCYVLDEPTAGLHPADTERLLVLIERLRDLGNTVVVVEHDPDVIGRADHVIELGPRGGRGGGQVLFEGTVEQLRASATPSGRALADRSSRPPPPRTWRQFLTVAHASTHNLRDVRASFPVGALSAVTGVSGSGKSTLINDVLFGFLMKQRGVSVESGVGRATVDGDVFSDVVLVDQDAIQTSSRSCPLTFSGAYGPVRELFADTPVARARGLLPAAFSFNTPGGRCERCEGMGVRTVEMHFIADVQVPCDVCDGRRFGDAALSVTWNGLTITGVLELTVEAALDVFTSEPAVRRALAPLARVGLGYVALGQPTTTMSGGELQRLKLASFLGQARAARGRLFIFDEPTVGLHITDVWQLLDAIRELVDQGDTAIVVEHNLDFVAGCDWVVDLGPGAGAAGGVVLFEGRVPDLARCAESVTAPYLRAVLEGGR